MKPGDHDSSAPLASHPPGPIHVRLQSSPTQSRQFTRAFRIGRSSACQLIVPGDLVSRVHAEVTPTPQGWRINDLNSANGLYLDGDRIDSALLLQPCTLRLGAEGPGITFEPPPSPSHPSEDPPGLPGEATIIARYFREPQADEPVGEHTQLVRRAFARVQAEAESTRRIRQTRRTYVFTGVITALLLAAVSLSIYSWRLQQERRHQRETAREIFYAMKALDVKIAVAEQNALATDPQHAAAQVSQYEASRRDMQASYDRFLQTLRIDKPADSEEHRLIVRVARVFGECEIDIPPDFEQEVLTYIRKWQSSGRFARDIRLAQEKGYTRTITQALRQRGLPRQFFYLAMQESDFNPSITGPLTRKGYAKGMWQFIPETGVKYGLHLGPLVDLSRPDPEDERDQVDKATDAAARYLDMLYSTDAQASGLLVMACYNWGEGSVLPLVRSMPPNPRQRNFWRLRAEHRSQIPQQTYDYVLMITAAAVIGENPRLFGFNFDNPLAASGTTASD